MKHRYKIQITVTDNETNKVIKSTKVADFFHIEVDNGFETSPVSPYNKQLNGRTKTVITHGKGIKHKDETL
jgi:hypothetical protein